VTALAAPLATRARGRGANFAAALLFGAGLILATPASAQTGAAFTLLSDYRFRGFSLSDGRPVAIFDLSYDAPIGFYAAASGSLVATRDDGVQPLGLQLNAGYAKRLQSGLTVDVGAIHSAYSEYSSRGSAHSYTEAYAGLAGKLISTRVSVSPDYLSHGAWTVYGELNGTVPAGSKLRFTGHVGMLVPVEYRSAANRYRHEFDWRVGVARDIGRVSIHADWTGARPGDDIYSAHSYRRSRLVLGLTYAL
jgi:uncharacterized protein (TIGR02001 family)